MRELDAGRVELHLMARPTCNILPVEENPLRATE